MISQMVIAVLAVLLASSYYSNLMDQNKHFFKHYPGDCKVVNGHNKHGGSEDLQVTSDGLAFVTSGVTFSSASQGYKDYYKNVHKLVGKIYLYDFNKPDQGAKVLKIKESKSFDPKLFRAHGISILEDKVKGQHFLYVVNHPEDQEDSVEKFRFVPDTRELVHVKSIRDPVFTTTNDIALTGEDTFYISNFIYFSSHLMEQVEATLQLPLGCVVFYNGTGGTCVTGGLPSPNGVTLSKDQRFLYVSLPLSGRMQVYQRHGDDSIELVQDIKTHNLVDNFHLTPDGDGLFTGSHPLRHKIVAFLEDPSQPSPSSVLHLPLKDGLVVENDITEVFYDHGHLISASTIAARHGDKMIIGSVLNTLVVCEINANII